MTRWPDIYLKHFSQHLGLPFDVQTYHADNGDALRLATFDQRFPEYRIYGSLGLSEHAEELKERGEIILFADDLGKDIPMLFVNMLFFILENRIPLGRQFAIGGVEKLNHEFADEFDKAAIYVTLADGVSPGFERFQFREEPGIVWQGFFISWSENDFLNRKGPAEFEERLRAQEGDLWSLSRPSCV